MSGLNPITFAQFWPKKYPPEFLALWESDPIHRVCGEYVAKGGRRDYLAILLYWLWVDLPKATPVPRSFWTKVRRLRAAVIAFEKERPNFRRWGFSEEWGRKALEDLKWELGFNAPVEAQAEIMEHVGKAIETAAALRDPQESVVCAILAKEFCRVFGGPRYEKILTLARTTAPNKFLPSITKKHIRQRILLIRAFNR